MADIADKVAKLELWRDGNGRPGAAAIQADHEKRIIRNEALDDCQEIKLHEIELHHAVEKDVLVNAVLEVLKKRARSAEGIVKAFAPYFAALISLLIALKKSV
jgi:hypothetical protein